MKWYYLLQASYWAQQLFVLVLKIEKPRKDYTELVIHHLVTIWLIGCVKDVRGRDMARLTGPFSWSYLVNLTWIGNAVFITMDWSDVFLAASDGCPGLCRTIANTYAGLQNAELS